MLSLLKGMSPVVYIFIAGLLLTIGVLMYNNNSLRSDLKVAEAELKSTKEQLDHVKTEFKKLELVLGLDTKNSQALSTIAQQCFDNNVNDLERYMEISQLLATISTEEELPATNSTVPAPVRKGVANDKSIISVIDYINKLD